MQAALAVCALDSEDIGFVRRLCRGQNGSVRRAQINRKDYALFFTCGWVLKVELDISRTEDRPSAPQANPELQALGFMHGESGLIGQRDDALFDQLYIARPASGPG